MTVPLGNGYNSETIAATVSTTINGVSVKRGVEVYLILKNAVLGLGLGLGLRRDWIRLDQHEKHVTSKALAVAFKTNKKILRHFTIFPDFIFIFQTFSRSGKLLRQISKLFQEFKTLYEPRYNRRIFLDNVACSRRLDSGEQVKSYVASAKRNTRGKKRGETGAALFFPSPIFRPRPDFSLAPHHLNAWNFKAWNRLLTTFIRKRCTLPAANRHETHQNFKCLCHIFFTNWKFVYPTIISFL